MSWRSELFPQTPAGKSTSSLSKAMRRYALVALLIFQSSRVRDSMRLIGYGALNT